MAYKQVIFANDEIYHIYNRGVEERSVFSSSKDCERFLNTFLYYQKDGVPLRFSFKKGFPLEKFAKLPNLIEIIGYCLMPNHFHFLLRQKKDKGITSFLSKATNSYTRYFNVLHKRIGPLFQGSFKAKRIEDDNQLLHVSRYIHLNPVVSFVVNDLNKYPYSSYLEYIHGVDNICRKNIVMDQFPSREKYQQFVLDQVDYGQRLNAIKHLILE